MDKLCAVGTKETRLRTGMYDLGAIFVLTCVESLPVLPVLFKGETERRA